MSRYQALMAELNDPRKFVRVPGVSVFDAHTEEWYEAPDGRPCSPDEPGAVKKSRTFSRAHLERIARRCNRRDRTGTLSPIMLGHTNPREKDERKQPPIVGYAHGYSVGWDRDLGRWTIQTNYYFKADRYEEAKEYPRSSIELWPAEEGDHDGAEVIDPIALLKRTPARDLGQWAYCRRADGAGRARTVLRYSRESRSMPDRYAMPDDLDGAGAGDPPAAPPAAPEDGEEMEQFMRHCFSHPHAMKYAKRYALPAGEPDAPDAPDAPGAADPTLPPDAGGPDQFGLAAPSAANAWPPGGQPSQFARQTQRVQAAQYERRIAALEKIAQEAEQRAALAEGQRYVTQLVGEGYDLDADQEAAQFARRSPEERERYAEHVRRYYRQAPVADWGRVPVEPVARAAGGPPDGLSPERQQKALQYMRQRPGMSFDEALEKTK